MKSKGLVQEVLGKAVLEQDHHLDARTEEIRGGHSRFESPQRALVTRT